MSLEPFEYIRSPDVMQQKRGWRHGAGPLPRPLRQAAHSRLARLQPLPDEIPTPGAKPVPRLPASGGEVFLIVTKCPLFSTRESNEELFALDFNWKLADKTAA